MPKSALNPQQDVTRPQRSSKAATPPSAHSLPYQNGTSAMNLTPAHIPDLQRSMGNRAVQTILADRTASNRIVIQPKLKVGAANDRYEAEADRVSTQVMRSLDASPVHPQSTSAPHSIQRLPAPQVGAAGGPISGDLETRIQGAAKGGKSIQPTIRRAVENATGADLSGVRYHDDKNAHGINAELGAKASTHKSHIFLGAGQSPHNVQLMAHELTHTVQQGASQVQRAFWSKKKAAPTTDATMFDTGKAPEKAFFTVRVAVKMGTANRGTDSLQALLAGGAGHSWLEIHLGPAFPTLQALADDPVGSTIVPAIEDLTKQQFTANGKTTVGFYPAVTGAISKSKIAKQITNNLPGKLIEPEQAQFAGSERGAQGFPVTDAQQAIGLFNFIQSYRGKPYNIYRNNCTDFVNKAVTRIGYSMGKISGSLGITMPTLLYKQIYKRSELGDRSASHTALENKTSKAGRQYDVKHLKNKSQKKLDKQKTKVAPMLAKRANDELWARAIEKHTAPGWMGLQGGGMMRANETVFGVTGVVKGPLGEVIVGTKTDWVNLLEYEMMMGEPYPEIKAAEVNKPIEKEQIDELSEMDMEEADEFADDEDFNL